MKTGVQVSSLKPLLKTEEEVRSAFEKLAAMGCETVQLQWIDPAVPVEAIARAVRGAGLRAVAIQDYYDSICENTDYYIQLNGLSGGEWFCVSRIPERLKSRAGLDEFIGELRALQLRLNPFGQKLCFHPVAVDYQEIEGVVPVEYLLENMPELSCCLDLYHLNRNGLYMPGWIRDHAGRICMVHFKDGIDGRLTPAGQGATDWSGVVGACLETGVSYAFVEQESWEKDPFECLKEALDWLNGEMARN